MKNSIFWSVALRNSKRVCGTVVACLRQRIDRNLNDSLLAHFATPLSFAWRMGDRYTVRQPQTVDHEIRSRIAA